MNYLKIILLSSLLLGYNCPVAKAQKIDSLGLPGDNLNLYGVLFLFKESKTVEEFEKKLNTSSNKVNNLDLNHDGQTDYIRVMDYGKNGLHTLILTDPITAEETQDIAVIEVEQNGDDVAHIQIVGDEDLYGKNYIIEPQTEQQSTQAGPEDRSNTATVVINVWSWPGVQYMYTPTYIYWSSPWYWGYYPQWWSPWYISSYPVYWQGTYGYRNYHRRMYRNRMMAAHNLYYGGRRHSEMVHNNIHNKVYYGPRREATQGNSRNNNNPNPRNNNRNTDNKRENRDSRSDRQQSNPNPQPGRQQNSNQNTNDKRQETKRQDRNPNPQPNRQQQNKTERKDVSPNPRPNTPKQERSNPRPTPERSPNPRPGTPAPERNKPAENKNKNPNPRPNAQRQNNAEQGTKGGGRKG